jgi:hypothetical protein
MFEQAGFKVYSWRYLSNKLQDYEVIVWAPDNYGPPPSEQREFLETWLEEETNRTLVFIGRDFDASSRYWEQILPTAPADQQIEIRRRLAQAQSAHQTRRLEMPSELCVEWFTMRRDGPRRRITRFAGAWSGVFDAAASDIWAEGQLAIPTAEELAELRDEAETSRYHRLRFESLLRADQLTLVSRVTKPVWVDGQVLVVTNGSFLLNLPLVNHQHRLLASQLIGQCGPPGKVAFLESGAEGPLIIDAPRTSPDAVRKRVLLAIHWFALGILACFYLFPIFGRPKTMTNETEADFGKHIEAVGALLQKTGDARYARKRLEQYHEIASRDMNARSGVLPATSETDPGPGVRTSRRRSSVSS